MRNHIRDGRNHNLEAPKQSAPKRIHRVKETIVSNNGL